MRARLARHAELARFATVAVLGLVVDLAVAWSLAVPAGVPLTAAAGLGFLAGAVVNYLLHELWTFRDGARRLSLARALRFGLALAATLAVRLTAVAGLARLWPGAGGELVILVAATGVSFFVTYAASKFLVFRSAPEVAEEPK